ncbi:hypothetical protein JJE00_01555 [Candidatus Bathyarchaeota archaeon]|nr:hypothetical protein [Candidatus Bathyarchaeota archaeon]
MTHADLDLDDALIQAMQDELDRILMNEVCESLKVDKGLGQVSKKELDLECDKRKNSVLRILNTSVRTQRLYFVLRSIFMGLISALITFSAILYLGTINFIQAFFLGIFVFVFSLVFTRLFDEPIVSVSMKIIRFLEKHNRLRSIILKTF